MLPAAKAADYITKSNAFNWFVSCRSGQMLSLRCRFAISKLKYKNFDIFDKLLLK
jgi:hypothetical protein